MESQQTTPSLVPLTVGGGPSLSQGDPAHGLPEADPGLSLAWRDPDAPGTSLDVCPCCGGHMVEIAILSRSSQHSTRARYDTS